VMPSITPAWRQESKSCGFMWIGSILVVWCHVVHFNSRNSDETR
jgi:hypothetical protein